MHTTRPFEAPPVLVSDPDMRTEAAEDDETDNTDEGSKPRSTGNPPGSLESEDDK